MRKHFALPGLLLVLAITINTCKGDLPIHCVKSQVVGEWTLQISKPQIVEFPYKMNCGHESPDNPANSYLALRDSFKSDTEFKVDLQDNTEVHHNGKNKGKWTMVYDEGLDIILDDHRFTSFFDYFPNATGQVMNHCGRTVVGWYKNLVSNEQACFRAEKIVSKSEEKELIVEPLVQMAIQTPERHVDFLQMNAGSRNAKFMKAQMKTDSYSTTMNHDLFAGKLNQISNKGWTAKAYPQFAGKSLKELNELAGRKNFGLSAQKSAPMSSFIETDDLTGLPKEFSWDKAIHAARDQRSCGSCYTMATIGMVEARLKIKYDRDIRLSAQHVLDCSMENQGCEGGYGFLVGMFADRGDLVPEDCSQYLASKGSCQTCDVSKLDETYRVKDYNFIGGSFGKSNAKDMMIELMNNGPIVVSFEPTTEFMYYEGGVYKSLDVQDWVKLGLERPEWQKVSHSVLLYGWGETESGEKYWSIQNSWGTHWGENGSFRMLRGVDESCIESVGEYSTPYIVKHR